MTMNFRDLTPSKLVSKALPGGSVAGAAAMITGDRVAFDKWVDQWVDGRIHGGIKPADRVGYALSRDYMRGLPPGLLMPPFATLRDEDIPDSLDGLSSLLHKMIAATPLRTWQPEIPTAIQIAIKNLGYTDLADHVLALWELRDCSPELYELAVLGDFQGARPLVDKIDDRGKREAIIRTLARHRIVWNVFDVHRVAAMKEGAWKALTPWFMRPFVESGTANEYVALAMTMASAIGRVNRAADTAELLGQKKVHVRGPKGSALPVVEPIARKMEARTSCEDGEAIVATRHDIRKQSEEIMDDMLAVTEEPDRNNQQSLFEHHFHLSEVGGLFFTAYRCAEDEVAMLRVMEDPAQCDALFDASVRPMPRDLDEKLITRARHLVAAYRPAVLNDADCTPYRPDEIIAAEEAEAKAHGLLLHLATANDTSAKERRAGSVFDLSHQHRLRTD